MKKVSNTINLNVKDGELIKTINGITISMKKKVIDMIVNDEIDEAIDFLNSFKDILSKLNNKKTDNKELEYTIRLFKDEYNYSKDLVKSIKQKKQMESNLDKIISNHDNGVDLICDLYNKNNNRLSNLINIYGSEESNYILYELSMSDALNATYEYDPSYELTSLAENVIHKKYFGTEPKRKELRNIEGEKKDE